MSQIKRVLTILIDEGNDTYTVDYNDDIPLKAIIALTEDAVVFMKYKLKTQN